MLNVTELWLHCYNKTNCLSEIQFFFFHVTLAIIVARTNQFQVEMQFSAHLNFQIEFGIFSRFWQFDQFLPIQKKRTTKKQIIHNVIWDGKKEHIEYRIVLAHYYQYQWKCDKSIHHSIINSIWMLELKIEKLLHLRFTAGRFSFTPNFD